MAKNLGNDCQTECSEISVESQAWHLVEKGGNYDKRDRIAKREALCASAAPKNLLPLGAYFLAVVDDQKIGFDFVQKAYGDPKT